MTANIPAIAILLGTFVVLILLRVNIAFAVGAASAACLWYLHIPLVNVCQYMVKGLNSFSLMAVPFFIVMGSLMGAGGISEKLISLADSLVGWMHGGLAMVNIVASFFFGGISGSATADTASLGNIEIPMMVNQGYDADFSTAVTIASSVEGIIVPPSHNMVIYATAAGGVSISALFMAGYIPGALLALSLMVGSYIISKKRHYPRGSKFEIRNVVRQFGKSFWALSAVLIVVVGVVGGVFTATESAAIAVIYSLIIAMFIYRGLNWKGVWKVLGECISTLSISLILCATSSAFGYCLTYLHVPDLVSQYMISLTSNRYVLIILMDLLLLFLGCVMDLAPIILITTPILLPIVQSIGLSPVQFGIMMVLDCGIGLLTPPVGNCLFIGSAISNVSIEKIVKATIPFYFCMLIVLMLISFIPAITLFLPGIFC